MDGFNKLIQRVLTTTPYSPRVPEQDQDFEVESLWLLKQRLSLDHPHPHSLDQVGRVELARLGQEIGAEAKIVLLCNPLTNISQPDVVQRPLLVSRLAEEAEHSIGRAACRVVAGEDAAQHGDCVESSR